MTSHSRLLTIRTLLFSGLLLVTGSAANGPCRAAIPQAKSDAELYVLEQVKNFQPADLNEKFPSSSEAQRRLRGEFLKELLTNRDPGDTPVISISHAVIVDRVDLAGAEIEYGVFLNDCVFENLLEFNGTHFTKSLHIINTERVRSPGILLNAAIIDQNFMAVNCHFDKAEFVGMRVGGDVLLEETFFSGPQTSFSGATVGGSVLADHCRFEFIRLDFRSLRVGGRFSLQDAVFSGAFPLQQEGPLSGFPNVSLAGGHFSDMFLNRSIFENVATLDLTGIETGWLALDDIQFKQETKVLHPRISFKLVSPVNLEKLNFLTTPYDAMSYVDLENSFRRQGYADEANRVFIAAKRAERRQTCQNFWSQCASRKGFLWSVFQDGFTGYGKQLQNLLYWSLGFLIIGALVFRSEKGMRTQDWKDMAAHTGKYHPVWYSLDLFLPIIKLGEADVWTPKENRRWAILYKRIHIIVGSFFVPIGVAAWTGIIK